MSAIFPDVSGFTGGASLSRALVLTITLAAASAAPAAATDEAAAVASRVQVRAFEVRPVVVIDRAELEASGASNLYDLLSGRADYNSFGLHRPLVTGQGGAAFLIDGRRIPAPGASYVLEFLPISAVERVEVLGTGAAALHAGGAIGGAVNIVLRRGHEGAAAWAGGERPGKSGGNAGRAGGLWGGKVGEGHLTAGAEWFHRSEVRAADRAFSRARWTEGGGFADTAGVSVGGNTLYIPTPGGVVTRPLGACDRSRGYTGVLNNPGSNRGSGCGFAWADIAWTTERLDRRSVFASFDHPFGDDAAVYFDGRFAQGDTAFRFAPPVGAFTFSPSADLRAKLLADPEIDAVPDRLTAFHRFVAHGNRDWRWDLREHDATLGLEGGLPAGIGYDLFVRSYRHDGEETGATFVSERRAKLAVAQGRYDIENPFSTDPDHLAAVREMKLTSTVDRILDRRTARAALDGDAFALPGGKVGWAAGVELDQIDERYLLDHHDASGNRLGVEDVLGSGGISYAGERSRRSGFAEVRLPLLDGWEVASAARIDRYDDVGSTFSWQLASALRPHRALLLRGSVEAGRRPPSMSGLHAAEAVTYPYLCDAATHAPPHTGCDRGQIKMLVGGNPALEPDRAQALGLGVVADLRGVSASADWFRIERTEVPARVDAQRLIDHAAAGRDLPPGAEVIREGGVLSQVRNPLLNSGETAVTGFDAGARAAWRTGWVDTGLDVRWLYTVRQEVKVDGETQPGDFPRHRVHATLSAKWDRLTTVAWNVYGVSGYENRLETGKFDSWTGHDLLLSRRDLFGLEGTVLRAGVLNVTDRGPSTDSADPNSVDARLDSVRGRTLFLSASMTW